MQKRILFVGLILVFLATGCSKAGQEYEFSDACYSASNTSADCPEESGAYDVSAADISVTVSMSSAIYVYVCGAVNNPGVYELTNGSRIVDAVDAAGGFTEEADTTYINLAALLSDGIKIKIPTLEEVESGQVPETSNNITGDNNSFAESEPKSGLVNINTATCEELKTLPGIGDVEKWRRKF